MENLVIEILLAGMLFVGSSSSCYYLVRLLLLSNNASSASLDKERREGKVFYIVKIISAKILFIFSLFFLFYLRGKINYLTVCFAYTIFLCGFIMFQLRKTKKNSLK
jgi:hypothetical protein